MASITTTCNFFDIFFLLCNGAHIGGKGVQDVQNNMRVLHVCQGVLVRTIDSPTSHFAIDFFFVVACCDACVQDMSIS